MNSAQAIRAGLELTKAQPFAKRLVREGETQYLIKLKDLKTEVAELKDQDKSMLEKQKSASAYSAWVDAYRKSARIQTNTGLTAQAQ
jgi:peptidyl-prolyl cis-trans isomerase D